MSAYDEPYHAEMENVARQSAGAVVSILADAFHPQSVIDVGCGRGTWLAEWRRRGVMDVLGVDGGHQDPGRLLIPRECFVEHDLNAPFTHGRRYNLAMCLEVGEHLRPESADALVATLTKLSDIVVFSAAIPRQGGLRHINEQWPSFWATKFADEGYVSTDALRWNLMSRPEVSWWYRQNLFVAIQSDLYASAYGALPRLAQDFYVMHESVYRNYSSRRHRLKSEAQQLLYNHANPAYRRLLAWRERRT